MDVVLYEKHSLSVFSINDDPATTYYPCEGVIAVGEIKSRMASTDLDDTFAKIASVTKLRRCALRSSDGTSEQLGLQASIPYRAYGSPNSILGTKAQEFDQDSKPLDQIFGFSLAGSLELIPETLCAKYATCWSKTDVF